MTEDHQFFLIGHLPIMVSMYYVVNFGRSKKTVFLLKYKILSTPLDVLQTTPPPQMEVAGWYRITCIQRVIMRPLIAKTNVPFCKDYTFL